MLRELWGIPGNGVHVCSYCCGQRTRHFCVFPRITCTNELKIGLGTLRKIMHLFFSLPCPRRGRPCIQNAQKTRRKAVPEMCLFSRVENNWAIFSISVKGWGKELGTGKGTWSFLKTYHLQGKMGVLPMRSWGEQRQALFQCSSQSFRVRDPCPKGNLLRTGAWSTQGRARAAAGMFWSSEPQRKGAQMQRPGESPALTVDPWALGALRKQHT